MRVLLAIWFSLGLAAASSKGPREIRVAAWTNGVEPGAPALKEFTATLDGAPAKVLGVKGPGDELMLLLVLDMVGDLTLVDAAKKALVGAIEKLPDHVWVGLLRAQDGLHVLLDPTPDRSALAEKIREQSVSGRAGLLETVETAARVGDAVLAKSKARLAILYVTDSNVYNYREDLTNPVINYSDSRDISRHFPEALVRDKISKVQASLASLQPPIFILHLDYRSDRLNEAYQTGLLQLASSTGGAATFCRTNTEIPSAVEKTLETIASSYSLTIALPERPLKSFPVQVGADGHSLNSRPRFVLKER